jgi:DNA-binding transcriptional ArsR family regulator
VIRIRLSELDLTRIRLAYSPLTEVGESLYLLHSGNAASLHHAWRRSVGQRLATVDTELLRAVVPTRGYVAKFFLGASVSGPGATIEQQLDLLREMARGEMRLQLERVWAGEPLPAAVEAMLADPRGLDGLAADLHQYWQVAIHPYWPRIRSVLDADIAYRTARLARGGIEALMGDLHPALRLQNGNAINVAGRDDVEHDLHGAGLLLLPCAFAWPNVVVGVSDANRPSITYGPRGIGTLWKLPAVEEVEEHPLAALLGRSRAAILTSVMLPRSTTELARELGQSPPAVSGHLAILRRNGLVSSWRAGRRVLYQATPLASGLIAAGDRDAVEARRETLGG